MIAEILNELAQAGSAFFEVDDIMHGVYKITEKGFRYIMYTPDFRMKYKTLAELKKAIANEGKVIKII